MHIFGKRTVLAAGVIALSTLAATVMLAPTTRLRADEEIEISSDMFPDAVFRQEVKKYDLNKDGFLQEEEIQAIKELNLSNSGIKDLTGIEFFTDLEKLDCSGCEITDLNLTCSDALRELNCSDCKLTRLEIWNMEFLEKAICTNNELTSFYAVELPQLTYLDCSKNPLETFEILTCPKLKTLYCQQTSLEQIFLGGDLESLKEVYADDNKELTSLICDDLGLSSISVKGCTNLESLSVLSNNLKELDLKDLKELVSLFCDENEIGKLDISHCPKLEILHCGDNPLESLDFSKNPLLEDIYCASIGLTDIDISMLSNLKTIVCSDNDISTIDVSKNTKLQELYCSATKIKTIDVSMLRDLDSLSVSLTDISKLDISRNPKLTILNIGNTKISSIDLSNQQDLECLWMNNTLISEIDLSHFEKLVTLDVSRTKITYLDLCRNRELEYLTCDELDLNTLSLRFNSKLVYLEIFDSKIKNLNISPCNALVELVTNTEPVEKEGKYYVYEKESEDAYVYLACNKDTQISTSPLPMLTPCPALAMPNVISMKSGEAKSKIKKTFVSPAFCKVDITILMEDGTDPDKDLYVTEQSPEPDSLHYGNHSSIEVTLKVSNNTPAPTPIPPATMPNVVGSNYLDAQETILKAVKPHGFTDVNFKIEWVENDDPKKSLTVLEQDPKAGVTLYGSNNTLDVTLKVAKEIGEKDPTFEDFVERLYTVALNRASEPEGKAFWIKQVVEEGKTGADCARFFLLDADEFMKRGLSVEEFVETLYATFFDRESDPAGKKGWVDAINTGAKTRAEVVNDFIESTEWCDVCATYGVKSGARWHKATKASKNSINFATRLYTCCLKRDPEEEGIKYWSLALTNLEKTGASAAQFFFEGEEFVGFNTSDREYLMRLYTTFMDREPAEEEIQFWIGEMKAGKQTRKSILAFFAQSPEFTSICKKYGIDRGEVS